MHSILKPPAPSAPGRAAPEPPAGTAPVARNFEYAVGRYAALGVGAALIVTGTGALVSWAVAQGLLGPWLRVGLGAVIAAGFGAGGIALRARNVRGFGNALLGLAIALTHVVAWAAGPGLNLLPWEAAFLVANGGSLALAALAVHEGDEVVFALGAVGAMLAPFTTAMTELSAGELALYGVLVIGGAVRASGRRPWRWSARLTSAFTLGYTLAIAMWGFHEGFGAAIAFATAIAAAGLVWEREPGVGLAAVVATALGALLTGPGARSFGALVAAPQGLALAAAAAVIAFAVARRIPEDRNAFFALVAALVPLALVTGAVDFALAPDALVAGVLSLLATGYAGAAWFERGRRRTTLLLWCSAAAALAIGAGLALHPTLVPPAFALYALAFSIVARRLEQRLLFVPPAAALGTGAVLAMTGIAGTAGFAAVPFVSEWSLGFASIVVAAFVAVRAYGTCAGVDRGSTPYRALSFVPGTLALLWGFVEVNHAFSRDAATLLRIAYCAAAGAAAVYAGRRKGEAWLRHAGLGLSLLASWLAFTGALGVASVLLRAGSYFASGAFLLIVAWWYRHEAEAPRAVPDSPLAPAAEQPTAPNRGSPAQLPHGRARRRVRELDQLHDALASHADRGDEP